LLILLGLFVVWLATTIYYLKSSQGFLHLTHMLRRSRCLCTHPKRIKISLSLSLSLSHTHTHTHTHTQIPVLKEDHGSVGQDFPNHKSSTTSLVVSFLYQIGLLLFLMKSIPPDLLLCNTSIRPLIIVCLKQTPQTCSLHVSMFCFFYNTL